MKKFPTPYNSAPPTPAPQGDPFNNQVPQSTQPPAQPPPQPDPTVASGGGTDQGFGNFVSDIDTLQKIKNPHFPHKNAGVHIPFWLSPAAAKDTMMRHGPSGNAFPHPNMPMMNKK
jgi:hypothetical protein